MTDKTVATTILAQLGGNRFLAMTGAKNLTATDNSLSFRLPGRTLHRINAVRVTLDPSDTYTVTFSRIFRKAGTFQITEVEKCDDIYCDVLQEVFARVTGLATHL